MQLQGLGHMLGAWSQGTRQEPGHFSQRLRSEYDQWQSDVIPGSCPGRPGTGWGLGLGEFKVAPPSREDGRAQKAERLAH